MHFCPRTQQDLHSRVSRKIHSLIIGRKITDLNLLISFYKEIASVWRNCTSNMCSSLIKKTLKLDILAFKKN